MYVPIVQSAPRSRRRASPLRISPSHPCLSPSHPCASGGHPDRRCRRRSRCGVASGMGSLISTVVGGTEPTPATIEIKEAEVGDFYANCMARGGGLPPGISRHDN